MLSTKFFSICIISRLYLHILSFQYGRSKMILLFVQFSHSLYLGNFHIGRLSMTLGTSLITYQTCSDVNIDGSPPISTFPFLKVIVFLLNVWSLGKNLWCKSNQLFFIPLCILKAFVWSIQYKHANLPWSPNLITYHMFQHHSTTS